jgi:hypothetical protein
MSIATHFVVVEMILYQLFTSQSQNHNPHPQSHTTTITHNHYTTQQQHHSHIYHHIGDFELYKCVNFG